MYILRSLFNIVKKIKSYTGLSVKCSVDKIIITTYILTGALSYPIYTTGMET